MAAEEGRWAHWTLWIEPVKGSCETSVFVSIFLFRSPDHNWATGWINNAAESDIIGLLLDHGAKVPPHFSLEVGQNLGCFQPVFLDCVCLLYCLIVIPDQMSRLGGHWSLTVMGQRATAEGFTFHPFLISRCKPLPRHAVIFE